MKKLVLFLLGIVYLLTLCGKPTEKSITEIKIEGIKDNVTLTAVKNLDQIEGDEIITANGKELFIYKVNDLKTSNLFSFIFKNDIIYMHTADIDNDGQEELVVSCGAPEEKSKVSVYIVQFKNNKWKFETILNKETPNAKPVNLDVADINNDEENEIILSYLNSESSIETIFLKENEIGLWKEHKFLEEPYLLCIDFGKIGLFKENRTVLGTYKIKNNGGVYIYNDEKITLPISGNIELVKVGDGNNNTMNEIYIVYKSENLLNLGFCTYLANKWRYKKIDEIEDNEKIEQLEIFDIDNDGRNELVIAGDKNLRIYKYKGNNWGLHIPKIPPSQFSFGDINNDKKNETVFSGEKLKIYRFGKMEFEY